MSSLSSSVWFKFLSVSEILEYNECNDDDNEDVFFDDVGDEDVNF